MILALLEACAPTPAQSADVTVTWNGNTGTFSRSSTGRDPCLFSQSEVSMFFPAAGDEPSATVDGGDAVGTTTDYGGTAGDSDGLDTGVGLVVGWPWWPTETYDANGTTVTGSAEGWSRGGCTVTTSGKYDGTLHCDGELVFFGDTPNGTVTADLSWTCAKPPSGGLPLGGD